MHTPAFIEKYVCTQTHYSIVINKREIRAREENKTSWGHKTEPSLWQWIQCEFNVKEKEEGKIFNKMTRKLDKSEHSYFTRAKCACKQALVIYKKVKIKNHMFKIEIKVTLWKILNSVL